MSVKQPVLSKPYDKWIIKISAEWLIPRLFQYGLELLAYWFMGCISWRAHVCSAAHMERAFLGYWSLLVQAPLVNKWWVAGNLGLSKALTCSYSTYTSHEWPLFLIMMAVTVSFPISRLLTLHLDGQMGLILTLLEANNPNCSLGPVFFGLGDFEFVLKLFFHLQCTVLRWVGSERVHRENPVLKIAEIILWCTLQL